MSTTQDFSLILASQSAQRALLLRQLGLPFEQKSLTDLNVDDVESLEMELPQELPADYVSRVAQQKWLAAQRALAHSQSTLKPLQTASIKAEVAQKTEIVLTYSEVFEQLPTQSQAVCRGFTLLLTADTTVSFENTILHKPENTQQAYEMIRVLSGQTHDVRTAICVGWCAGQSPVLKICHSRVRFMPLTHAQCLAYAQSGEGLGRAGGYAIQGKAAMWIEQIEGSYSSIMGLPLFETAQALEQIGVTLI